MEEPNSAIRWAMFHFGSGDAFLFGLLALAIGQILLLKIRSRPRLQRSLTLGTGLALLWSVIDPAPVPVVLIGLVVCLGIVRLAGRWWHRNNKPESDGHPVTRGELVYRLGMAGFVLIAIGGELRCQWFRAPAISINRLSVVGDSVTAGLNDGEDTWPMRVSRQTAAAVLDASQPGATLKSARKQVELLNAHASDVLILEIGGNDLLEGLPVEEFERDLSELLTVSQKPGRAIVMLELPLPPLAVRYCAVQRHLAAQHAVHLVPRRHFLRVLTMQGSTVDGIHLSKSGQARLAGLVQTLLTFPAAKPDQTAHYLHLEPPRRR